MRFGDQRLCGVHAGDLQRSTEPCDVGAERARGGIGRLPVEDGLDQAIGGHHRALLDQQGSQ